MAPEPDADCIEDLLQPEYRHVLIFRFLVTADDLFTNTRPAGEFGLSYAFGDSHLRDKGRDLVQSFDT